MFKLIRLIKTFCLFIFFIFLGMFELKAFRSKIEEPHKGISSDLIEINIVKVEYKSKEEDKLNFILKKCANYCEKLSSAILFFICEESIQDEVVGPSTPPKHLYQSRRFAHKLWIKSFFDETEKSINEYTYDYQLIRKDKNIVEKRILIEKNGKKKNRKNAKLETRFAHKDIIFGPIGLLGESAQSQHNYKIVSRDIFADEKVIIIEAIPKNGFITNHLYGKIWIRENDYGVLKIEWYQESVGGYEVLKELAEEGKLRPEFIVTTEFYFEKNGIRFPSKHQLIESYKSYYSSSSNQKFIKSKKIVEYKNYKFFLVETEVTNVKEKKEPFNN